MRTSYCMRGLRLACVLGSTYMIYGLARHLTLFKRSEDLHVHLMLSLWSENLHVHLMLSTWSEGLHVHQMLPSK